MNFKILTVITVISFSALLLFPDLDLALSRLFLDENKEFFLRKNFIAEVIYNSVHVLTIISIAALPVALFYVLSSNFKLGEELRNHYKAVLIMLIVSLSIAPGLLTHEFFKEYWGRSRPKNVTELGGTNNFTQFYEITDKDGKSFTSGHAGFSFWTYGLAYLYRDSKRRRVAKTAGLTYGFIVSTGRIVQGGHFLSDVISGGLLSLWTIEICRKIFMKEEIKKAGI